MGRILSFGGALKKLVVAHWSICALPIAPLVKALYLRMAHPLRLTIPE